MSSKQRTPLGYINDLSDEQSECLSKFKRWAGSKSFDQNPWFNDSFYLKFCRARKFEYAKVILMFSDYMSYRKENQIDTIIGDFHFDKREEVYPFYPRGYCGVDKMGRPIYIEQAGFIKPDKVWAIVDQEYLWKSFYKEYELTSKHLFMSCSVVRNKQVFQSFTIIDLTNISIGMFGGKVKQMVQSISKIAQDYYPEQLGCMFIINAPALFTGVWSLVKGWLDERTRQKINIVGKDYKSKLLQYCDEDQLPTFLGGTNTSKLVDNVGPWNQFKVIDGHKKSDVVGVKRITGGKIYTPAFVE